MQSSKSPHHHHLQPQRPPRRLLCLLRFQLIVCFSAKTCTNSGANKSSNESNTCATWVGAGKLVDAGVTIAVVVVVVHQLL